MGTVRRWAKQFHDRLFRNSVYTVKYGYFRGYKLVGRMPWFQNENPDPKDDAERQFFEDLPLEQKVFYDIGSHQGPHSFLCHRLIGAGGHVYAFEPDPVSSDILQRRIQLNEMRDIEVFTVGLGDKSGTFSWVVPDSSTVQMAATLSDDLKGMLREEQIISAGSVKVVRLDDWYQENQPRDPDLLKIDVEGFEI
jgi:FkbM family methyltransferase